MKKLHKRDRMTLDTVRGISNVCTCKTYSCTCRSGDKRTHSYSFDDLNEFAKKVAVDGIEPWSNGR